jgi:hypothetical protein
MLIFLRQKMVGDAEKRFDANMHADFFVCFPNRAFLKSLQIIQFAADDAPRTRFWRQIAEGEKDASPVIEN